MPRVRSLLHLSIASLFLFSLACSRDDGEQPSPSDMSRVDEDMGSDLATPEDMTAGEDMMVPAEDMPDTAGDMPADMPVEQDMAMPEPLLDPETLSTAEEAFDAVDPFVGTGGLGFGYSALTPAAQAPLGLVKLGPDTTKRGSHAEIQHMSGYNFSDLHVRGFSHLHFVGTGVADYGNLRVIPTRTLENIGPDIERWYATPDRAQEDAEPGYYTTYLKEPAVAVELAASPRGGAHRYAFDSSAPGPVYLAIDAAARVEGGRFETIDVSVTPEGEVRGSIRYRGDYVGRGNPFTLHFSGVVSPAPDRVFVWNADGTQMEQLTSSGTDDVGVVLEWEDAPTEPVELRIGVSMVAQDAADASLSREIPLSKSLEEVRQETRALWLEKLGKVRVAGGTASEREIFFTALYNAYRMPTRLDEPDGRYPGIDGQIHEGITHPYYSDLSLWDSFRTTHPWYTLVEPELQRDCLKSLLQMARDGGTVPRWPAMQSYTGGMIGTSADVVFGDSAAKGITGIDWNEALAALMPTAEGTAPEGARFKGRTNPDLYKSLGYLPVGSSSETVSRTLEFAYHDWGLAQVARAAGNMEEVERLEQRAGSWRNLLDDESGFFRAKDEQGAFGPLDGFDPTTHFDRGGSDYTEGSAWHWRFYVPHDPVGLAQAVGEERFAEALATYFSESEMGDGSIGRNILPDSYYWHGNQPPLHTVYMFHAVGDYDALAGWVERIRTAHYDGTPAGLPGNDDGGTLSSWYLFSAIGFFPIAGDPRYALGTPLFTRVEIALEGGGTLEVLAPGAKPGVRGVEGAQQGGEAIQGGYILHQELISAPLEFEMKPL